MKWYYLDPDNNKKDPEGFFCARCKRKPLAIKHEGAYINIVKHPVHPWFRKAEFLERTNGDMIGADCLKHVIETYGEMDDPSTEPPLL